MPRPPKFAEPTAPQDDEAVMPDWFDPAKHFTSSFGIHDTASGALLDEDGQPQSAAVRAAMASAAEALRAAEASPEPPLSMPLVPTQE